MPTTAMMYRFLAPLLSAQFISGHAQAEGHAQLAAALAAAAALHLGSARGRRGGRP